MENQIDEIKNKIDIVSLVNEYVPLKKAGRNYKALCPFHGEKTPSFMVSPDRQIFKCFGCGEGGDSFAFIKKSEGIEFGEAVKRLADRAGIKLKEFHTSGLEKKREVIFAANQLVTDLYNYLLTRHNAGKSALDYLHLRKISDPSIKKFQLGFAPEKGETAVNFLLKKGFSRDDLSLAGISLPVERGRIIDRFRGRVIFPIKDTQGRTLAFSARVLGSREPKYLNSPDTLVFNKSNSLYGIDLAKQEISRQKIAVLVEGNLDVISSHQVGVTNVVAPLGTALTDKQIETLRRFSESLLIGFDTDLAGSAAAKRGIDMAERAGLSVRVIDLVGGKDPDEIIRKDPTSWKKKIKESIPVYDFIINSSLQKWDPKEVEGRRKISQEVLPFIAKIADEITKDYYVRKIAASLAVGETAVRADLRRYLPSSYGGKATEVEAEEVPAVKTNKINLLERHLLALILQTGILPDELDENLFSQGHTLSLFQLIKKHKSTQGIIKLKKLSEEVPETLLGLYDDVLLYNLGEKILEYHEEAEHEISSCVARIKELNLRSKLRRLSLEIKQAEAVSEVLRVKSLAEQFRDLTLELSQIKTKG